ncbi:MULTISPECIES: NAD(P)/FAD-dependent oxidoreductase [unclassified Streptomyces]|uniref:flavin monoamine oxidase family protein n=1 Tax=unclassified Streptomyces TaxID=2593676 RepID=UPI001F04FA1E|nr:MULTISPECIES: NAD(P)/FAD-dependent oxidoreductase [unclassified Streptomyces]MCH0566880.1 FAD-dependent oxidoreductase [Streptomyces sp. MUM 2J]MCH0569823.1 FAD-dependent oxidoreductase [Streptomyces sp. MUM 136J]
MWQSPSHRHNRTSGERKRVTVLGAGIAGLVAAYELERLGQCDVEILEGSRDVGGRIRTHRFLPQEQGSPLAELGAMRIPVTHQRTLNYIAKLGLLDRVREFRTLYSDDGAYIAVAGGHTRVRDVPDHLVREFGRRLGEHTYTERTLLFGAWLKASMDAIAPREFRAGLDDVLSTALLDAVERIDLGPYLCGTKRNRFELHSVFADHPHLRDACGASAHRFLDDVLNETSGTLVRLQGGMDTLARALAARIQGPVRLGHEVRGIEVRDDGVAVHVHNGVQTVEWNCDHVLCTLPLTVLRHMPLTGFDEDKLDTIRNTEYWPATKIAFHCREPFWEADGIASGASYTGGVARQTYYLPEEGDPALGAVLLASYTIGADAQALSAMGDGDRAAEVLADVSAMHPQLCRPGMVLGTVEQVWGEDRWSRGAATVRWRQNQEEQETQRQAAARPQGRLFFAGEHCSTMPAWIEGAIESAVDAVHEICWYEVPARPADAPALCEEGKSA